MVAKACKTFALKWKKHESIFTKNDSCLCFFLHCYVKEINRRAMEMVHYRSLRRIPTSTVSNLQGFLSNSIIIDSIVLLKKK